MSKGNFTARTSFQANNPRLNHISNSLNELAEVLEKNIHFIIKALEEYTNNNFMGRVNEKGLEFDLKKLAQGTNHLVNSITEILVENKINALSLSESSEELMRNVNTLNKNSIEAAASLEETAAAIEEITSTIQGNTNNVIQMSSYANQLSSSSNEGKELASKTALAMDEINTQIMSINDAIIVIDQIAFQTNILSLNAAVEAATAGEAGKGFAVVAQEVRNLANRSADAAKDIKNLVGSATSKANEGKFISDKMIQGYANLNENISKTFKLISNIEMASKEQSQGMMQINDAVSLLDKQSQENVLISSTTKDVSMNSSKIAKRVMDNANEKQFEGKNILEKKEQSHELVYQGVDRRKKAVNLSFTGEEHRGLENELRKKIHHRD
jgi:methyl-accepting chemotaxis protein